MTSTEIRAKAAKSEQDEFLREIAAQLAEINEFARKERGNTSAEEKEETDESSATPSGSAPQSSSATANESAAPTSDKPAAQ